MRGQRGWCGGFGIVPKHRGRGYAGELMNAFLAEARGCGLKKLSLEVLTRNAPAIRLYERAGMSITRDLLIFERKGVAGISELLDEIKEAAPSSLLRHFERLHAWSPAWQRDVVSMMLAEELRGFYLGDAEGPDAYMLFVMRPDGITQVLDLAAIDERSADALAAGIAHRCGALRVVNEPEESLFIAALMAHGFVEMERQHEMSCEL
jgi:ribosomal protein S18 acetylase RimI-like enzyme